MGVPMIVMVRITTGQCHTAALCREEEVICLHDHPNRITRHIPVIIILKEKEEGRTILIIVRCRHRHRTISSILNTDRIDQ